MAKVPSAAITPSVDDGVVQEIIFYFFIKLATSLDDLVWLSPFVAIAQAGATHVTIQVSFIYGGICLLVSLEALALAAGAHGLTVRVTDPDTASRVLNIVGGLCIAAFAYMEWRSDDDENYEEKEDEEDGIADHEAEVVTGGGLYGSLEAAATTTSLLENGSMQSTQQSNHDHHHEVEESDQIAGRRYQRHILIDLFVVGICGTLDTLAVFFSVLMSQNPSRKMILPVLIGSVAAAALILLLAYSITLCRPLARCMTRCPLWALMCLIAVYILLSGLIGW